MRQGTAALLLATLAFITTSAEAQPGKRSAFKPYVGEVVGSDVYVRSGPDKTMYYATKLSRPARVAVVSRERGWLAIIPPAGCYSVVLKRNVDLDTSGKIGVIKGTYVWAHPGGFPAKPGDFSTLQKAMNPGEKVTILGQIGKYYKIRPPKGAYLWIEAAQVRRATGWVKLPAPKSVRTPPRPKATSRPAPKVVVTKVDPDLMRIRALDKQWFAEYKKPWAQRNLQPLLKRYQAVKLPAGSHLADMRLARIKLLKVAIRRVADVKAVDKLVQDNAARRDAYLKGAAKAQVAAPRPGSPTVPYSAQGVMAASRAFPGSGAMAGRGRFVLRDPKILRVRAYLRGARPTVNLAQYVGQSVGVYGKARYDATTQRLLIDVQKVVVISPKATVPSLPKPTVTVVKIPKPTTRPAKAKPVKAKPGKTKAAPKGRKPRDKKA